MLLVQGFSITLSSNHTILVTMHFTLHAVVFSLFYWSNVFSAFAVAPFDFTNVDLLCFSLKSSFYSFSFCFVLLRPVPKTLLITRIQGINNATKCEKLHGQTFFDSAD